MYTKTTKKGYEIKKIYKYRSNKNIYFLFAAIFYRKNRDDYGIALNYNSDDGTWEQGIYDFKSQEEAEKYLEEIKEILYKY